MTMKMIFLKHGLSAIAFSALSVLSVSAHSGATITDKLPRDPNNNSNSVRPRIPAYTSDFLTYTFSGTTLNIDFPKGSLPAILTVKDGNTNMCVYTTTIEDYNPITLDCTEGTYVLYVTLVNDSRYSGTLTIK